jgi:gluconolactonase
MTVWRSSIAFCFGLALCAGTALAQAPAFKPVEKKDPGLDALIAPDAKLELVKSGFGFTEGVTWVPTGKKGYLIFSDIPANVIYRLSPDGKAEIHVEKAGYQKPDLWRVGMPFTNGKKEDDPGFEKFNMSGSNGLALDRQGRIIVAAFGNRSIERIEKNGKRTVLADRYQGKRLSGPNDVIVAKNGTIYFTDTYSGMLKLDKDPSKEMNEIGVYMIRGDKITRLIDDIASPNGLALSPDEKSLYVNGGRDKFIRRYDVNPDGTLGDSIMVVDFGAEKAPGITDGTKVDAKGNIWTTGPGGIWVISPVGKPLGLIPLPEGGTNLVFGDADRKTLYISARTSIYKIRTLVPGAI